MTEYPEHFVRRLEILWGRGFMSPGGPSEVGAILDGVSVTGARVLDIGCGIGGPAMVIAEHGAAKVVAVDVSEALVERARTTVEEAGLGPVVECRLVEPGLLPFEDEAFDVVFSKDAFLHVEDKAALFAEILRVLKPGGSLAASDWLAGKDHASAPGWAAYRALAPYSVVPATAAECEAGLRAAGFDDVRLTDRNAWYRDIARGDLTAIEGPLAADLIAASSAPLYEAWAAMRRAQLLAVDEGALRPTHLRGSRPTIS